MAVLSMRPRLFVMVTLAALVFTLAVYITDLYPAPRPTKLPDVSNYITSLHDVSNAFNFNSTISRNSSPNTLAQSTLERRVLSWAQAITKGKDNFRTMASADVPSGQRDSRWLDYADLPKYGWSKWPEADANTDENYDYQIANLLPNVAQVSQAWPIGINLRLSQSFNKIVTWLHRSKSIVLYTPQGGNPPVPVPYLVSWNVFSCSPCASTDPDVC